MYLGYTWYVFFVQIHPWVSQAPFLWEAWVQQPPRMPETWRQKALLEQHVDLHLCLGWCKLLPLHCPYLGDSWVFLGETIRFYTQVFGKNRFYSFLYLNNSSKESLKVRYFRWSYWTSNSWAMETTTVGSLENISSFAAISFGKPQVEMPWWKNTKTGWLLRF